MLIFGYFLQLSLPKGLQLRTQKHLLTPHFHPFVITREDGSQYYGFSYTFYEEVNSKQICTALYSLQVSFKNIKKQCCLLFVELKLNKMSHGQILNGHLSLL